MRLQRPRPNRGRICFPPCPGRKTNVRGEAGEIVVTPGVLTQSASQPQAHLLPPPAEAP